MGDALLVWSWSDVAGGRWNPFVIGVASTHDLRLLRGPRLATLASRTRRGSCARPQIKQANDLPCTGDRHRRRIDRAAQPPAFSWCRGRATAQPPPGKRQALRWSLINTWPAWLTLALLCQRSDPDRHTRRCSTATGTPDWSISNEAHALYSLDADSPRLLFHGASSSRQASTRPVFPTLLNGCRQNCSAAALALG